MSSSSNHHDNTGTALLTPPVTYLHQQPSRHADQQAQTLCDLFERHARTHANRTAVIDGDTQIDYQRLAARANAVAAELSARDIQPGSLVGVCMQRTWELPAALLGILRAGCAYIPLDPDYPKDRVRYMLQHAGVAAVLVDHADAAVLCGEGHELLWLSAIPNVPLEQSPPPSPNDLAYVIYTSGSTGKPKGVAVEHRALTALSRSMRTLLNTEELSGVLAATSICFDPSVMEILGTLSLGGTVILAPNALHLLDLASVDRVKTCVMVPSAMQALLASGPLPASLQCLVFGGEILKRSLVDRLHKMNPGLRVVNVYGPTEDTVYSTVKEVRLGEDPITIGTSVAGSKAYILDEAMRPVPMGVAGELYLSGDKLARGYLHDEELTHKRFIEPGDHEAFPRERLYRTGDLCQWHANGDIEYLGRVDQQVKIRGFRIELEEIESVIETMPGVDAAAAAALDGGIGQKILVMYIVSADNAVTDTAVKDFLAQRLPTYMVPRVVMHLDTLPFLPNGKLDRKQLPQLEEVLRANPNQTEGRLRPGGLAHAKRHQLTGDLEEREHVLLSIIQIELAALLDIEDPQHISADLSFDELGLDSLTKVELSSRLSQFLGRRLPARAVFENVTASALVHFVQHQMQDGVDHGPARRMVRSVSNSLADFQAQLQSSHPTFQAAKATAWSATDKGKLVREVNQLVNAQRRNPYSKVLRTGSATRGTVADAYTREERRAIIWTTNLYLGLNRDERVIEEAVAAVKRFGSGMGTSAAASGLTDLHLAFESAFAQLVGKPAACLFPTGYTANLGAVAGMLDEHDVIVIDQLCHASIVDGARLSGSTIRTFQHNNPADLEKVLAAEVSPYRTVMVVIEGVYSMGEGAAPVADIVRMAKKYGALVLVDEAHSFGFYGPRGAGICAAQGVTEEVDFIMTTLSKSLGSLGGVIAAREEHIDLLKASARAYIFQASVSPADIAAALTALGRLRDDDTLRERLWDTAGYMRRRFTEAGYDLGTGDGPIVTPHFCDKDKLYAIVQGLYERGVQTSAVTYPIVERGRGRLRFICSASHTRQDVDQTLAALIEAEREADALLAEVVAEPGPRRLGHAEVAAWASDFCDAMDGLGSWPDLALFLELPDHDTPVTFWIREGVVGLGTAGGSELPSFSMLLRDDAAVKALCAWDVQALLDGICRGTCVLNGQVEPFIWFVGRLIDRAPATV